MIMLFLFAKLIKKALCYMFPPGNYRYYVWYIPAIVVTAVTLVIWISMLNLLIYGNSIVTNSFAASIPFNTSGASSELSISIMAWLFSLAGYVYMAFTIHTVSSLVADTIREIVKLKGWLWK